MTKRAIAAATIVGAVIGAAGAIGWMVFGAPLYPDTPSFDPRTISDAESMPRTELAQRLFGRIAPTFVADTRSLGRPAKYGIGFFAKPLPYGDVLCRVDVVWVPAKVVQGHPTEREEGGGDDLKITTKYAVERRPGSPEEAQAVQFAACSRYRDFSHLIWGQDGLVVQRAVNVLNRAVDLAKTGRINFTVTCLDRRQDPEHGMACDGAALLRAVVLRDIEQVDAVSETETAKSSARHEDLIHMRETPGKGCGQSEEVTFKVVSLQTYGRYAITDGDPVEVEVSQDVIC